MDETTFIPSSVAGSAAEFPSPTPEGSSSNLGHLATAGRVESGFGDDHALVWYAAEGGVERQTYRDLEQASARAAAHFTRLGLQPGDRILFAMPLLPELVHGVLGALRAGAVVSVLPLPRNLDSLRHVLGRMRPRVVVSVPAAKSALAAVKPLVPELLSILYVNRTRFTLPERAAFEGVWSEVVGACEPAAPPPPAAGRSRALLHFSEVGQTGLLQSHEGAAGLAATASQFLDWQPRECVMSVLVPGEPLFISYGILAPLLAGSVLVCHEDPARFTRHADVAFELQPRSWFSSFKAMDVMMRQDPNLGGLLKACRRITLTHPADPGFLSMFSVSFAAPVRVAWAPPEAGVLQTFEDQEKYGSAGRAAAGAEVRIYDEFGQAAAPGMAGRVAIRLGASAPFLGYWEDDPLTADRVRDGWLWTSKEGRLDNDGALWLEG